MRYMLDTNICIYAIKQKPEEDGSLKTGGMADEATSTFSQMEDFQS